jgi:polysaccharide deacetylase family protein (PEP-CTERM system associated)
MMPPRFLDQMPTAWQSASVDTPFISVVVPVRNEARHVGRTLVQLLAQDYRADKFEILVADGQSTDGTQDIVRSLQNKHDNLFLVDNPNKLASAGRNRAIEVSRGEIVVIVDGHCELPGNCYLRELAAAFGRSEAAAVGRPQPLDVSEASPVQQAIGLARSSWLGHNPSSHIYSMREQFVPPDSVAVAYRRDVFAAVGLFDESFDACEDVDFNHRVGAAGFTCFFAPQTRVWYHPRKTLFGLCQQMARYGRGRVRLLRKHKETLSLACVAPAALVAAVVTCGFLAIFIPLLGWPLFAGLSCYFLTICLESARIAVRSKTAHLVWLLPPVFAAIHWGAGLGILWEALCGSRLPAFSNPVPRGARTIGKGQPSPPLGKWRLADLRLDGQATESGQSNQRLSTTQVLNALTFDIEDYFHVANFDSAIPRWQWDVLESRVEGSTHKILDTLDQAATKATFFVLGWVADRHPCLVRAIQAAGHEIACHGYGHCLIYRQTPAEFRQDLRKARGVLEDITGTKVTAYRAPCFSITPQSLWALDSLIEEGFQIDSSIYPTRHDRYGLPGFIAGPICLQRPVGAIWEFPLPTRQTLGFPLPVGGGGYLRLYPYTFTAGALHAINATGRPFVTYLHPWEFDPQQPRIAVGRLQAFRHYVNLDRTPVRLAALLRDFRFAPLSEALERFTQSREQSAGVAAAA